MAHLFGKKLTRKQILERVGDIRQIAGVRRVERADGTGKGSGLFSFRTGTGFDYDVLIDRGMDIGRAEYQGMSLVWRSASGDAHPHRYDEFGAKWIRIFPGGLVTTCGLTQMGAPCVDNGEALGAHGRYTSLPASQVCHEEFWDGDDYVMRVSGKMQEAVLFGENLVLERTIESRLGQPGLSLCDRVTNFGYRPTPHMILYHCNFGYPLLDETTRLETPHRSITPRDAEASVGADDACSFHAPKAGYKEKVYFHDLKADRAGEVTVKLVNPSLAGGLEMAMTYRQDTLPYFTQWKMLGKGEYVCGLEPGNATVMGRVAEREAGRLVTLRPGESREYSLKIAVQRLRPGK